VRLVFKDAVPWATNPKEQAAVLTEPTDVVVVLGDQQRSIDRRRLTPADGGWKVEGTEVPALFHGAPVVVSDRNNRHYSES
jgi:hypothetical protein